MYSRKCSRTLISASRLTLSTQISESPSFAKQWQNKDERIVPPLDALAPAAERHCFGEDAVLVSFTKRSKNPSLPSPLHNMTSTVVHIADRAKHDEVVEESHRTPTVLHVSNSSLPTCREFSPRYEQLAQKHASSGIAFAEMDFNAATSHLFKFSPNQLPVTVAMFGDRWAKTVTGADMEAIEDSIELLRSEAKRDA